MKTKYVRRSAWRDVRRLKWILTLMHRYSTAIMMIMIVGIIGIGSTIGIIGIMMMPIFFLFVVSLALVS